MSFTVTLRTIVISAMWVLGLTTAVLDVFYGPNLAALSVAATVAAATLAVRARIDRYAANWEAAYGAGREVTKIRQSR